PVAEVAVRPGSPNAGSEAGSLGDQIYQNVQRRWSRPIPEPARAGLQPRWQAIEQEAAALRNRRTTAPNDPALQAADEAMARQRMSASGTVRGEARPGDGVRGASTAETNFRRTDEMVRQWVAQGEPITVERIA